jgi:asparagine N-glycosylation enzyme membrane subunit Stt3
VSKAVEVLLAILIALPVLLGVSYGWIFIISGARIFSGDQILALWCELVIGFILNAAWCIRYDL